MSWRVKKIGWHIIHGLTGVHLSTSTQYIDWSVMSGSFPVSAAKIQEKLPSKRLTPVKSSPDTATIVLRAIEVRKVRGLSPYNEFSMEVPVVCEMAGSVTGLPGSFVLYMPVTSEEARWGGVDVVGLPKFLAEIQFEDTTARRRCKVQAEGKDIVTLEVEKMDTEAESWDWYIYGVRDGELLRTHISSQGQRKILDVKGGASYFLGDHSVAEQLRALKIGAVSIAHEYAPHLQSLEDRPIKV
jgi:hypothetical protein